MFLFPLTFISPPDLRHLQPNLVVDRLGRSRLRSSGAEPALSGDRHQEQENQGLPQSTDRHPRHHLGPRHSGHHQDRP